MAEHINRYNFVAEFLNRNGFHVAGHDHLGHGGNKENGEGIFQSEWLGKGYKWKRLRYQIIFANCFQIYPHLYMGSMGGFTAIAS